MKVFKNYFFIFPFLLLILPSCSSAQKKGTNLQLSNSNFKQLVDKTIDFSVPLISVEDFQAHKYDYIVFDAREKKEFNVSHIPGAIYIGYDEPDLSVLSTQQKNKKLLFYCSIGYRSEKIAEKAFELGFTEVYNLYGGIFEWANQGNELNSISEEKTQKVHAYSWLWGKWIQNAKYEKVY